MGDLLQFPLDGNNNASNWEESEEDWAGYDGPPVSLDGDPCWSLDQVAYFLSLTRVSTAELFEDGTIPGHRVDGGWQIDRDALTAWLYTCRIVPGEDQ